MTELIWHDFFEIGVDFIDEDHKKLLKIMQDTKKAIEVDNYKKHSRLLNSLLKEANQRGQRE